MKAGVHALRCLHGESIFGNKDLGSLVTCRKVAILDRVVSRLERND